MTNPALATAAVGVVEPRRAGMASGVNSTFRQVGIATGIAAWGAIFQHLVNTQAPRFAQAVSAAGIHAQRPAGGGSFSDFISFGLYRRLGPAAVGPGRDAFLHGLNHILVYAGVLAVVGGALAAVLVRPRDFVAHGVPEPAAA
jgi:hypothetical protein